MAKIYDKVEVHINNDNDIMEKIYVEINMYEACNATRRHSLYYKYDCYIYKEKGRKLFGKKLKIVFSKNLYSVCECNPSIILKELLKYYFEDKKAHQVITIDFNNDIKSKHSTIIQEYAINDDE